MTVMILSIVALVIAVLAFLLAIGCIIYTKYCYRELFNSVEKREEGLLKRLRRVVGGLEQLNRNSACDLE